MDTRQQACRRFVRALATAAVLVCALVPPARAASADAVTITPDAPVQGDTVAIIVRAAPGSAVTIRFNGTRLPVFAAGEGAWRALRGTDPDTAPGIYTAAVSITPPGEAQTTLNRVVRIEPTRFGRRRITLGPSTAGLMTSKNLAMEAATLNATLARETATALWHGPFHLPVAGDVDSPYGQESFYNGRRVWWHQGADFPMPAGAPVSAANDGLVVLARALPLGGVTVIVDHGQGVFTEYLHLAAATVREGQRVRRDDQVGRIGATGLVTGPSLHWGLYAGGRWVNPLFWTEARAGLTR